MAKSKPTIMGYAKRAAGVLQEINALERDVSAWRLNPAAFLRVSCEESGISEERAAEAAEQLRRPGFEHARDAVKALAGRFRSQPRQHHAAGPLPWLFGEEARIELAALNLTLRMGAAVAAFIATDGGGLSEVEWSGRSPYPAWISEQLDRLREELEQMNREGEQVLTLADLEIVHAGDRDDPRLCRVTIVGTTTPALPTVDVVTRVALELPAELKRAA